MVLTALKNAGSVIDRILKPCNMLVVLCVVQLGYDLLTRGRVRLSGDYSGIEVAYATITLLALVLLCWRGSACPYRTWIAVAMGVNIAYDTWVIATHRPAVVTDWTWFVDALWVAGAVMLHPRQDDELAAQSS